MANCAVVRELDGRVLNTIVAEPTDLAPNGCVLIEMTPDNYGAPGWTWNGVQFVPPQDGGV